MLLTIMIHINSVDGDKDDDGRDKNAGVDKDGSHLAVNTPFYEGPGYGL